MRPIPLNVPVTTQSKVTVAPRMATSAGNTGGSQLLQSNASTPSILTSRSDSAWHDVGIIKNPKCTVSVYSALTNDAGVNVEVITFYFVLILKENQGRADVDSLFCFPGNRSTSRS